MRQLTIAFIVIIAALGSALGQSTPTRKPSASGPTHAGIGSAQAKPSPPQPKFLGASLDLSQASLGPDFRGHDIIAIFEAIKTSPALKEKSEFESTAAFEARRAGIVEQPLFGRLTPSGYFGFVISEEPVLAPQFKYDADSQTLAITLEGSNQRFIMDRDEPTLNGILIQRIVRNRDSYVGSNAFGASGEVRRTYSEEYGVAFSQNNWLFGGSERLRPRFTYLMAMSPDQARAIKVDAKLLLVCRLSPPWFRHGAHGHDATISEPYETLIGDSYLQAAPEQLWVFNQKTGEVIRKLSAASVAGEVDEQFSLRLRQTPLLLDVSPSSISSITIAIDDGPSKSEVLLGAKTFAAKHKIVLTLEYPRSLSDIALTLNGKQFTPNWSKDASQIGSYESIHSATAVITVP